MESKMKYPIMIVVFVMLMCAVSYSQSKIVIKKYNGTTTSLNLSDIKSISFVSNLIQNGDFKDSLNNWTMIGVGTNPYHPADPGRANFTVENGKLVIDITNQGTGIYSIMLYQSTYFEKETTYTVSFDAKADAPCKIISNVTQDGTWANFSGDKKFDLTNTMTGYSYEFKATQDGAALFQFCLGAIGTGKMYFDNIVVMKK
jgi:hypothetical protein